MVTGSLLCVCATVFLAGGTVSLRVRLWSSNGWKVTGLPETASRVKIFPQKKIGYASCDQYTRDVEVDMRASEERAQTRVMDTGTYTRIVQLHALGT